MLDLALSFFFSNIWIISLLGIAIYNNFFRPEHTPIIHMALITATVYAISHIFYSQWVSQHPVLKEVHYLYLAGAAALLALWIYLNNKLHGFVFYWPVKLLITMMVVEVILDILLHIDRNIVALNGMPYPNEAKENAWWLWTLRNIIFNLDNLIILVSMVLPVSLLTEKKSPKNYELLEAKNVIPIKQPEPSRIVQLSTTNGYRNIPAEVYLKEVDNAYNRVEGIQDLIDAMPEGEAKETAKQYAYTASELITRHDQSKFDYLDSIHLLCDRARDFAVYSDHVNPKEKLKNIKREEHRI